MRAAVIASVLSLGLAACDGSSPIERLGEIEARRDADAAFLITALTGPSAGIRARAARTAGRIQSAALVGPLVPMLADPDPTVRAETAFALGQIALGRPDARARIAAHLVSALERVTPNPEAVVAEMVRALGKTRARPHRGVLRRYLHDPRPAVASAALLAFTRMGVPLSDADYRAMIRRSSPRLRWQGLYLAGRRARPELRVDLAGEALGDTSAVVRAMAARALRGCPAGPAGRALAEYLAGEMNESVQIAGVQTLCGLDDPAARAFAVGFLSSPWPEVRAIAAQAASGDAGVAADMLPFLLLASHERYARVRAAVAGALARVPHPDAAARFAALVTDSIPAVRAAAVRAVSTWAEGERSVAARRLVDAALGDESPQVRRAALATLAGLDPPAARAEAERRLRGEDLPVVLDAIETLVTLAERSPDTTSRARTLRRLMALRSPACRPQVTAALFDAARRLSGDDPCVLLPFMTDRLPGVRARAFEAALEHHPDPMWCTLPPAARVYDVDVRTWPLRPYPDADELPNRAELITDRGSIVLRLHGRDAPMTVAHVVRLVRAGRLDGALITLAAPDSLVAFGSAPGDVPGELSESVPPEITTRPMVGGAVALLIDETTRAGDARIFIALRPLPELEGRHTVFGTVVSGLDRIRRIQPGERVRAVRID